MLHICVAHVYSMCCTCVFMCVLGRDVLDVGIVCAAHVCGVSHMCIVCVACVCAAHLCGMCAAYMCCTCVFGVGMCGTCV